MSTAVIYRRQSLDRAGDELGIDRQLAECERVAKARGILISHVVTDNDFSASKRGRPGYDRLVKSVSAGQVTTIVILRIDRLLRLNDELEELIVLVEQKNVHVVTCEGEIDLSTPQGRLLARILVSVARSEMEIKGARHKLANSQRAQSGLPHAGRRAFGYNNGGMTIREDEALILKDIAHRFLNGWTYTEIAYYLNAQGLKTAMGSSFVSIAIRQLLQRKRYVGIREYEGVEYQGVWPTIYDRDTWARIQYTIKERSASIESRSKSRRYLLTGLLECGACGFPMNGSRSKVHQSEIVRHIYRCKAQGAYEPVAGCGRISRGSVPLEHFIKEMIIYRLDSEELRKALDTNTDPSSVNLLAKLERNKERVNELVDDYADDTLTKSEFKRAKARAVAALRATQDELSALHGEETMNGLLSSGESVRSRWDEETTGWRRQVIDLLIEKIVVNAGKKKPRYKIDGKTYYFAPEYVDVIWKV